MKPSDSPRVDPHCAIPVRAAIFSTTAGNVASLKTVMSGRPAAVTAAILSSFPAPPRQMLYVRIRSATSVGLRFIDKHEVWLADQLSAEIDHHVPGRLN